MSSFALMHIRGRPAPKKKVCNFIGGVRSPLLFNVALHGMEQALGISYTPKGVRRGTYALVRYADDLVVLSPTHEKAVEAQHILSTWLGTRGLRLSGEKTHIRHLREGFNFL